MPYILRKAARLVIHKMIDQFEDGNEIQAKIELLSERHYNNVNIGEGNIQDTRVLAQRLEDTGYLEAAQYLRKILSK